jgi:hypothetical protein
MSWGLILKKIRPNHIQAAVDELIRRKFETLSSLIQMHFLSFLAESRTPSLRSRRRWIQKSNNLGDCREFERRANWHPASNCHCWIRQAPLFLVLFRAAFPKATAAEVAAFLYRNTLNANPVIFSPTQIAAAEDSLGLTRKRVSTLAMQALRPENVASREMF